MSSSTLVLAKEMDDKTGVAYALLCLGLVDLAENKPEAREQVGESAVEQIEAAIPDLHTRIVAVSEILEVSNG